MTSGLGNISVSGSTLLSSMGGVAGKIDTDALITALMNAKAIPQQQLQSQAQQQAQVTTAYQGINSTLTQLGNAADNLMDTTGWSATKASSSSTSVAASSVSTAPVGSSTFNVTQLASTQVSTVAADSSGNVVDFGTTPSLTLTVGGQAHSVALTSGSAADVAKAINDAKIGVQASTITVDDPNNVGQTMTVLQLTGGQTGAANSFTATGLSQPMTNLVSAGDAKISVGTIGSGGYTVSSATNTFTDAIPGVTFTVSKVESGVTVSIGSDTDKISGLVQSLVNAANSVKLGIGTYTGKGQLLQGDSMVNSINESMSTVFSSATASGKSLTNYGIELTQEGVVSFDPTAFATAYAADPTGTMQAISDAVGSPLKQIATDASAPITGSLSQAVTAGANHSADLNSQIATWSDRLNDMRTQLTVKYTAMQSALMKLQSQGDWLTSMFKSMEPKSS